MHRNVWTALLVAAAAAAMLAVTYGGMLAEYGPRLLMGRSDHWNYMAPMAWFLDWCVHHGHWPWWNPLLFCGAPFAANPQTALYYPPQLARALLHVHPTPAGTFLSLAWMQAAHLVWLACGTFLFARALGQRRAAALLAGLAYLSSAAVTFRVVQHWPFVAMASWLPWVMLLLRHGLTARGVRRRLAAGIGLGLAVGVTVLIGFPQLTLYLAILAGGYAVLHRLTHAEPGKRSSTRLNRIPGDIGMLLLMGLVAVLIALPMLLPAAEFGAHSVRAKEPFEAASFINPKAVNPFTQPARFLQVLLFFPGAGGIRLAGATALLLALYAARHCNRAATLSAALLLFAMLDCSLGPPWPMASLVSVAAPFVVAGPERAAIFAAFWLCLLAGFGLDALLSSAPPKRTRRFRAVLALVVAGVAVSCLAEWGWLDPEYPRAGHAWIFGALGACTVAGAMVFGRRPRLLAALACALLLSEQWAWNRGMVPFWIESDACTVLTAETLAEAPDLRPGNRRGAQPRYQENLRMFRLEPVMNGYDPLVIRETWAYLCAPRLETAYNRHMTASEVASENVRGNLRPKRRFWLVPCAEPGAALPGKQGLFPPAQVAYLGHADGGCVSAPGSVPPESARITPLPVFPDMRRTSAAATPLWLPWLDTGVGHSELVCTYTANAAGTATFQFYDAETGEHMPGRRIVFPAARRPQHVRVPLPDSKHLDAAIELHFADEGAFVIRELAVWEDTAGLATHLRVASTAPNSVEVAVENLPRAAFLVRTTPLYPGWRAYVDGQHVRMERADSAFQAVRVPAGTHRIRFEFRSKQARVGLAAGGGSALVALAALAALALGGRPVRRRMGPHGHT